MMTQLIKTIPDKIDKFKRSFRRDFWDTTPFTKGKPVSSIVFTALKSSCCLWAGLALSAIFIPGAPLTIWAVIAPSVILTATITACAVKSRMEKPDKKPSLGLCRIEGANSDVLMVQRTAATIQNIYNYYFSVSTMPGLSEKKKKAVDTKITRYFNDARLPARCLRVIDLNKDYQDDFDLALTTLCDRFPVLATRLQTRDGFEKQEAVKTAAAKEKVIAEAGTTQTDIDMPEGFVVSDKKRVALKI